MIAPVDDVAPPVPILVPRRSRLVRDRTRSLRSVTSPPRRRSRGWNSTVGLSRTTVSAEAKLTEELLSPGGLLAPTDRVARFVDVIDVTGTGVIETDAVDSETNLNFMRNQSAVIKPLNLLHNYELNQHKINKI